jgi:hypothetical protein
MRTLVRLLLAMIGAMLCAGPAMAELPPPVRAFADAASGVEVRIRHGDDPRWAAADFDDSAWEQISAHEFPARTGIYWARIHVRRGNSLPKGPAPFCYAWPADEPGDGIFASTVFSFDLFWDGRLLHRSGVVGASHATEVPGALDHFIRIPDELRAMGDHVIALRMSSYHYNFPAQVFPAGLALVELMPRMRSESRQPMVPLMLLAGAALMSMTSLVMFLFAERRRSLLLCTLLSLTLAVFYGLVAMRWVYNLPFDWHAPRLAAIAGTTVVIAALLPWLLTEHFGVLRRGQWLLALVPLLIAAWSTSPWYEVKALWLSRAMLLVSLGIIGWAAWRRRPGAWWLVPVFIVGLFLLQSSMRSFLNPGYFLFLEGMVFFVFAALGLQVRAERQRSRELVLMAARLEAELLKKNLQPHFLLNTLATIIEMIEQTPKNAVGLIEALATEFRILARVSGETLIPLAHELELCHAHLGIMSLRKGAQCALETDGIEPDACVPPALFHTLIENGLTHLLPRNGEQRFHLHASHEPGLTRYVLTACGERHGPRRPQVPAVSPAQPARDGTGIRYIKARLEESFPGRWTFTSQPVADGWQTIIELRAASSARRAVPAPVSIAGLQPAHESAHR